jgi:hypothetical protein
MDTFERTQVVSHIRPHAFSGVDMNFSNSIAIIVTSPFMICMANGSVVSNDVIVGLPLIGIASGFFSRKPMDMRLERFSICVVDHT